MASCFRAALLSGRRALVTGGCGGIGTVVASELSRHSASVVVTSRSGERIASTVNEIRRRSNNASASVSVGGLICDMSDPSASAASVRALISADGAFDIIVHCAAHSRDALLLRLSAEEMIRHFTVNVAAVAHVTASAIKPLIAAKQSASIISIGSVISGGGVVGAAAYSASKAALTSLTRSMAREYGRYDIRCNMIESGLIQTPMTEGLVTAESAASTALGRIGTADDIAAAVIFLCSDASRFISGHTLVVDGGLHRR